MIKTKVFIADDDMIASRVLSLRLEKTGAFEVKVENIPTKAVTSARQFNPDIIFLDVCMPGADGNDVAFQIQSDAALKSTPIVFLTSLISEREEGVQRGGNEFLAKPVNLAKVMTCINRRLTQRAASGKA